MPDGREGTQQLLRSLAKRRGQLAGAAALIGAGLSKLSNPEPVAASGTMYTGITNGSLDDTGLENEGFGAAIQYAAAPGQKTAFAAFASRISNNTTQGRFGVFGSIGVGSFDVPVDAAFAGVWGVNRNTRNTGDATFGVRGETVGFGAGVRGLGGSNAIGVWGDATVRAGVFGAATANSGVFGVSAASNPNGAAAPSTPAGVSGQGVGRIGVQGISDTANGVQGSSTSGNGVQGQTSGSGAAVRGVGNTDGIGVWGDANHRAGVFGTSLSTRGIFGVSSASDPNGTAAPSQPAGVSGQGFGRIGVQGVSDSNVGVQGTSTSSYGLAGASTSAFGLVGFSSRAIGVYGKGQSAGIYGVANTPAGLAAQFAGNVVIQGSLTVTGSYPKSAAVKKRDGTQARMYCMESPESWFEDFGTAPLAGGQATVDLDPEFDQVVRGDDYRIFLTEIGDCGGLFVGRKGPHRFVVKSRAGVTATGSFDYRVVARRLDDVGKRMEPVETPPIQHLDQAWLTRASTPTAPPKEPGR